MPNSAHAAAILQKRNQSPASVRNAVQKICLERFSATSVEKNINFLIEHQCPQCGAPAILEETDHLFSCDFCRVKSYLKPKNFYRYVLPDTAPKNKNLVFFPYWRFKGMLFSCLAEGIRHRFIDVSHQAIDSQYFPISVGLRSQALKLKFVSPQLGGRFLKTTLSSDDTLKIFKDRFSKPLPPPILHQAHIGEALSLIYSPFYFEDKIYDAILNKPVSPKLPEGMNAMSFEGGRPGGQIDFIPALCPDCGWDLEGRKESLVLSCRNCNSLWEAGKKAFKKLKFAHIPEKEANVIYMPFWRMRAEISEVTLNSYSDLIKIANLPVVSQNGWEAVPFRFWVPAFKVRPKKLLSLSRNITLFQPREELIPELPQAEMYPITLPVREATESLKINLAGFMKPPKKLLPKLPDIDIKAKSFALIYIPFIEKHHDLVQPLFHQAINKNLLSMAKNL